MASAAPDQRLDTTAARAQLRAATRPAHDAVEAVQRLSRLLSPGLSRSQYADTQSRFHGVYAPLEASLAALPLWRAIGLEPPGAAAALADDLRAMAVPVAGLPLATVTPVADPVQALGRIYVLEGSALGARTIATALRRLAWFDPAQHGRYFLQAVKARRWPRVQEAIDRVGTSPEAVATMAAEAQHTFATIRKFMEP